MGGLFITQLADGIMGYGMTAETIVPHMVRAAAVLLRF